jgi:homocysteine S-methyltransferase
MTGEQFVRRRWVSDGAMATLLFSKGASPQEPVETLNLTVPQIVADVHREYLEAGAQILRTNTFRANEANRAGVRIAQEVARGQALVAGVIGSTGGRVHGAEARDLFRNYAAALEGVDIFILETFRDMAELGAAVEGVRDAAGGDVALIAQVSVEQDGRLHDGTPPERYGPVLNAMAADVIGFNCCFGPESVMAAFERMRAVTDKPMSASPNAGFKTIFTPEYMADYAGRFLDAGALIVGTCCGSTPEHTRQVVSRFHQVEPIVTPNRR